MIRSILNSIREREPQLPPWSLRLPVGMIVVYLIALFTGLLMATTLRDDDIADPQAASLVLGGAIGSVAALTLTYQYAAASITKKKERTKDYSQTVAQALGLTGSRSRPLWIVWLLALAAAIGLDTITLMVGKPDTSLPLGLDRIGGSTTAVWLAAAFSSVLLRPAAEELIFRGMLYPALVRRMEDNLAAVGVTAALFAAFYFVQFLDFHLS